MKTLVFILALIVPVVGYIYLQREMKREVGLLWVEVMTITRDDKTVEVIVVGDDDYVET